MKKQEFEDLINRELNERGFDDVERNEFWCNDYKTSNGDNETLMDFIFKKFVNCEDSE